MIRLYIIATLFTSLMFSQIQFGGTPKYYEQIPSDEINFILVSNNPEVDRDFNPMVFQFGFEYDVDINDESEDEYMDDNDEYEYNELDSEDSVYYYDTDNNEMVSKENVEKEELMTLEMATKKENTSPPPPVKTQTTATKSPVKKKSSRYVIPFDKSRFTIQVASKKNLNDAEKIAANLIESGYDAYIQKAYFRDTDEVWFRVRVGSYDNRGTALRFLD